MNDAGGIDIGSYNVVLGVIASIKGEDRARKVVGGEVAMRQLVSMEDTRGVRVGAYHCSGRIDRAGRTAHRSRRIEAGELAMLRYCEAMERPGGTRSYVT